MNTKRQKRKANRKKFGSEKYRNSLGAFGFNPFTTEKEFKLVSYSRKDYIDKKKVRVQNKKKKVKS